MRIIASVQAKRSSSRGLVHYIAHSKTDPNKEPKTREIFNEYSDQTTVKKSNEFLKTGTSKKRPGNEELHHLVISLKEEDYVKLGSSEKEKQNSLKTITRHALGKLKTQIGADKIAWAAGIHRNTNNPHVHIAIQKIYFDKNLDMKKLTKIPKPLLPHYEKVNEEKVFNPGILITEATKKLDEISLEKEKAQKQQNQKLHMKNGQEISTDETGQSNNPLNSETQNERDILASAILAKFYLDKSKENIKSLENHGDKRRFKITDKITNKKRKMSLFDLERLATREAGSQIKNLGVTDPIKKDELKKYLVEIEIQKNADGIKRIKTILREIVTKENQTLRRRENKYKKIKPLATEIRQKYRKENMKLPVPNLNSEDLEMLQNASLDKKDIRTANYFERVRKELARERDIPTRTKEEISHLKAKQIISKLKVFQLEKQSDDFEQRKRNFSYSIEGKKWSLAKVDSFAKQQILETQKISKKISKTLGKIGLVSNEKKQTDLNEIKTKLKEKLEEKNGQIISNLKNEKLLSRTLENFYKNDTNPEKDKIPAKFSAWELADIEAISFELKDEQTYQENWIQQKQFINQSKLKDKTQKESFAKLKQNTIAGRALAKEVMSEIELARSKEELELFDRYKRFQKFEIKDTKLGESKSISLKDVEFDFRGSLLDQTIAYFIENREIRKTRHKIEDILDEKQTELKNNLKSAIMIHKANNAEASNYKTKSFFATPESTHAPLFTPKELIKIELRIKETEDKSEAKKLQNILEKADHSKAENLSAILKKFAPETEFFKSEKNMSKQEMQNSSRLVENRETLGEINKNEIGAEIIQKDNNLRINMDKHIKGK